MATMDSRHWDVDMAQQMIDEHHRYLKLKFTELLTYSRNRHNEYIVKCSRAVEIYRQEKLAAENRMREMAKEIDRLTALHSRFEGEAEAEKIRVKVEIDDDVEQMTQQHADIIEPDASTMDYGRLSSNEAPAEATGAQAAAECREIEYLELPSVHHETTVLRSGLDADAGDADAGDADAWFQIREVCSLPGTEAALAPAPALPPDNRPSPRTAMHHAALRRKSNYGKYNIMYKVRPNEIGLFVCPRANCGRKFYALHQLKEHFGSHFKRIVRSEPISGKQSRPSHAPIMNANGNQTFVCTGCGKEFNRKWNMERHMEKNRRTCSPAAQSGPCHTATAIQF